MPALIEVQHLKKYFDSSRGKVHAVDDVSFKIEKGHTMGVVGESGCGKSTLGRTMIHLLDSTDGKIFFEGKDITVVNRKELRKLREDMKRKLLIADDEPWICSLLQSMIDLDAFGLELAGVAHDGGTLLAMARETGPDLIITDINMPKIDGLECIRRLTEEGMNCRFIVISGYRQFEYAYTALRYGVKDLILKPISKEELDKAIANALEEEARAQAAGITEDHRQAVRRMFVSKVVSRLKGDSTDITELNRNYCLTLAPGAFRVFAIHMDFLDRDRSIMEDISGLQKKLEQIVRARVGIYCHELLFEIKFS